MAQSQEQKSQEQKSQEQKSHDHWTTKTERMIQEQGLILKKLLDKADTLLSSKPETEENELTQQNTLEELFTAISLLFKLTGASVDALKRLQDQLLTASLTQQVFCEVFASQDLEFKLQVTVQRQPGHGLTPSAVVLAFSLLWPENKSQKFNKMANVLVGAAKVANAKGAALLTPWRSAEVAHTSSIVPAKS